jgi:glutaredoxin
VLVESGLAPLVFSLFRFLQITASCAHQQITGAAMKITVYSKSACPQCDAAKKLLTAKGMAYEEVLLDDEAGRIAFYEKCGPAVRQMPQIFIDDQRVGGLAGLHQALCQLA